MFRGVGGGVEIIWRLRVWRGIRRKIWGVEEEVEIGDNLGLHGEGVIGENLGSGGRSRYRR